MDAIRIFFYKALPVPFLTASVNLLIYLGMIFRKKIVGPRILQISLPSGCNHNCEFCITEIHGKGNLKHKIEVLEVKDLENLIKKACRELTLKFNIVSNGEPTLSPIFEKCCQIIEKESFGKAKIKIITNGTSLHKISKLNFKTQNIHIWLSLHSVDFKTWKLIHRPIGENALTLYENLTKVLDSQLYPLTLHFVLTKDSLKEISKIKDYLKRWKPIEIHFGDLSGHEHLNCSQLTENELETALDEFHELQSIVDCKNNINFAKMLINNYLETILNEDKEDDSYNQTALEKENGNSVMNYLENFYTYKKCYLPWLMEFISEDKKYFPCYGNSKESADHSSPIKEISNRRKRFLREISFLGKGEKSLQSIDCTKCPHRELNEIANKYTKLF